MTINNEILKEHLQVILNKPIESISALDLTTVNTVRISTSDDQANHIYDLQDLQNLKNLERVIISNSLIGNSEMNILLSLESLLFVEFEHCVFEDESLLTNLNNIQSLTFNNCIIRNYSFLEKLVNLTELQILNPYDETELDLGLLSNKALLKKLYLEGCILNNFQTLALPSLEELSLLNTSIDELDFINRCPKFSSMFLPERYLKSKDVKNNVERILFKTDVIDLVTAETSKTGSK